MTQPLRLICVDLSAPPRFGKADPDGTRRGYEPSAAAVVAEKLGRPVEWVITSWGDMIPAVNEGRGDAIWCGQGITAERSALVDDDVALIPVGDEPDLKVAFTIATRNRWGVAVAKCSSALRTELNGALAQAILDGSLEQVWKHWMPNLAFPLTPEPDQ